MNDKQEKEVWQVAGLIAEQLGEDLSYVRGQIKAIVTACGVEQSLTWLHEALEVESHGGLLVENGKRRRTPGGVFFSIARSQMPEDLRDQIFVPYAEQRKRRKEEKAKVSETGDVEAGSAGETRLAAPKPVSPAAPIPPDVISRLLAHRGEATTVKITLIGRPGKTELRGDLVVTTMTYSGKQPSLPKGMPPLPDTPTNYVVYVAAKQWKKVEEALVNPEDSLVIEGHCTFDPRLGQIAVYALSVITKLQQRAKWQAEDQKNGPAPAEKTTPDPNRDQKLAELRAAEQAAAERVNNIKSVPTAQQQGLFSAMRELQRLRDEIRTLEG